MLLSIETDLIIVKTPLEQPEIRPSPPPPPTPTHTHTHTHTQFVFKCGDFSLWFADGANDNHKKPLCIQDYIITYSLISM